MDVAQISYRINRHDQSNDRSLRPWNAADEYLLSAYESLEADKRHAGIYHDRFGFLTCHLSTVQPTVVIGYKSQENAILLNLKAHKLDTPSFCDPLSTPAHQMSVALVKIPKSLALFRLYLDHICRNSSDEVTVICGFMTRHFSPKLLDIAQEYFEEVEQSRAHKKSRLLTLKSKKPLAEVELVTDISYKDNTYRQYPGVFSGEHIDYGTQFLLDNVKVKSTDQCVLDLASGNGVIAAEINKANPTAQFHLVDDAFLAVASAKLNISGDNIHHHWSSDLASCENEMFDLIATNPPFHFEYENNIGVSLTLFQEALRCLKKSGSLQLVANRHLNYKTHLTKLYGSVEVLAESDKYIVYRCTK